MIDARRSPGSFPFHADRVRIIIGRDSSVGGGDDSRGRIVDAGKLVEGNVAGPLVGVVCAADGQAAVSGGANWNFARGVIADVAIHVGVHHVLSRRIELRKCVLEIIPVLRSVHVEERHVKAVVKRPAQRQLAGFAGNSSVTIGPCRVIFTSTVTSGLPLT